MTDVFRSLQSTMIDVRYGWMDGLSIGQRVAVVTVCLMVAIVVLHLVSKRKH